jgi:hypothetical protein
MEGYKKTDNVGFNKITGDNVVDIEAVAENFEMADESIGNIKETSLEGYDEVEHGKKSATNLIKFIWSKLGSIELTDMKIKVTTWENHTLDKVLSKLKGWIGTMGLLKTKEKSSLVGAVNELVYKDTEIVSTMGEYKASVDEYSKQLGVYVERHRLANDRLEALR